MQPSSATPPSSNGRPLTAQQVAERILAAVKVAGSARDRIVAGDPLTPITGIATTAMASVETLRKAAAKGCNLIVSHDPAFWLENDQLGQLDGNRLLARKRDLIRENGLVVLHLGDGWESGVDAGMARTLGWEGHREVPGKPLYRLPGTTLLALAKALHGRLDDRTMRIVGDPTVPVTRVAASWGNARQLPTIALLNGPADVVVCGYSHEWEAVEYAQDMIAGGAKKGLILLGQAKSLDGGMEYCAEWLRTIIPGTRVEFIAATEPYWTPQHPIAPTRA